MGEINNHVKEVMGIQPQPKPSVNPLNWNWTAIITWSVMSFIGFNVLKFLINLI